MGQGALSKPVVQWWLSLNSSILGPLHLPSLPPVLSFTADCPLQPSCCLPLASLSARFPHALL